MAIERISKDLKPSTSSKHPGGQATISYDLGNSLQDAIAKFGEETVFELFQARAVVAIQSEISKIMTSKDNEGNFIYPDGIVPQETLDDYFNNYTLSYKRGRSSDPVSKISKAVGDISKMSDEAKAKLIKELKEKLGL